MSIYTIADPLPQSRVRVPQCCKSNSQLNFFPIQDLAFLDEDLLQMVDQFQITRHSLIDEFLITTLPPCLVNVIKAFVPLFVELSNYLVRPVQTIEATSAKLHFSFTPHGVLIWANWPGAVWMTYDLFVAYLWQEFSWEELLDDRNKMHVFVFGNDPTRQSFQNALGDRFSWEKLVLPLSLLH
jgi:hypothetical protein